MPFQLKKLVGFYLELGSELDLLRFPEGQRSQHPGQMTKVQPHPD